MIESGISGEMNLAGTLVSYAGREFTIPCNDIHKRDFFAGTDDPTCGSIIDLGLCEGQESKPYTRPTLRVNLLFCEEMGIETKGLEHEHEWCAGT